MPLSMELSGRQAGHLVTKEELAVLEAVRNDFWFRNMDCKAEVDAALRLAKGRSV